MNQVIELFGFLIITFIGFVFPVFGILISLFPEGIKKLTLKYENEKKRAEENIKSEIEKKKDKTLNVGILERNLRILKKNKKTAGEKLSYLNPKIILPKIFIFLLLSLIGVMVALSSDDILVRYLAFVLSLLFFGYTIYILWKLLGALTELSVIVKEEKTNSDKTIIRLLSASVEKTPDVVSPFLNEGKVSILFNKEKVVNDKKIPFSANKKYQLPISIVNSDERMAKKVEVGFIFPLSFMIEETSDISSIYTGENHQIVRFEEEFIQSDETNQQGNLNITFLKVGPHNIRVFIKGENIKVSNYSFTIEVID